MRGLLPYDQFMKSFFFFFLLWDGLDVVDTHRGSLGPILGGCGGGSAFYGYGVFLDSACLKLEQRRREGWKNSARRM